MPRNFESTPLFGDTAPGHDSEHQKDVRDFQPPKGKAKKAVRALKYDPESAASRREDYRQQWLNHGSEDQS